MRRRLCQALAAFLFIMPISSLASDLVLLKCTTPEITSYLDKMVYEAKKNNPPSIFDDDEEVLKLLPKEVSIKFKMPIWQLAQDSNLLFGTTFSASEENGAWEFINSKVDEVEIAFETQTTQSTPPVKIRGKINRENGKFQASLYELDDKNSLTANARKVVDNDYGECKVIKNAF
jgi:hypothetical protein